MSCKEPHLLDGNVLRFCDGSARIVAVLIQPVNFHYADNVIESVRP